MMTMKMFQGMVRILYSRLNRNHISLLDRDEKMYIPESIPDGVFCDLKESARCFVLDGADSNALPPWIRSLNISSISSSCSLFKGGVG